VNERYKERGKPTNNQLTTDESLATTLITILYGEGCEWTHMNTRTVASRDRENACTRGSFFLRSFIPFAALLLSACGGGGGSDGTSFSFGSTTETAGVSLNAYPPYIHSGETSTLSWSADSQDSCSASGGWKGKKASQGSTTVGPLTETTVYTLSCEPAGAQTTSCKTPDGCNGRGPGKRKDKSTTVVVDDQPPPPTPTVSFAAAPTSILAGEWTTLSWSSTDASDCEATDDWTGTKTTTGNESVGPLTASSMFTLTCSGAGGSASESVVVTVDAAPPPPVPTVLLTASSTSIASGGLTTLSWSSTDATTCEAFDGWSGTRTTSGNETRSGLMNTTTFTLTCSGDGGISSRSVTVMVQPPSGTASLSWSPPTTNEDGTPVTLTGFNIYAGSSASSLLKIATVGASQTSFALDYLSAGTYYFAVTAIGSTGESSFSNIEGKVISQ
jgi:hypothetical protein